jgi:hypothetical protein
VSASVNIPPGGLGALIRSHGAGLSGAVERGVRVAKQRAVRLLKERTPVDQGVMRAAWAVTKNGVENDSPIAGIIEKGARPHKVSKEGFDQLYEWVRRKVPVVEGRIGPAQVGARGKRARFGHMLTASEAGAKYDKAAYDITWAIVKRLEREGYKGTHFVEKAMPEISDMTVAEISESVARALRGE